MPTDQQMKNLVSLATRTTEEKREIGKKGGAASGAARRRKKTIREELIALLAQGKEQELMCFSMIKQAKKGNVKAFEVVRDTIGEGISNISLTIKEKQEDDALSASLKELAEVIESADK